MPRNIDKVKSEALLISRILDDYLALLMLYCLGIMPKETTSKKTSKDDSKRAKRRETIQSQVSGWYQYRWLLLIIGIAVVAGVIAVATPKAPEYYEEVAAIRDVVRVVRLNGQVEPVREAQVGFETGGRVASVSVTEGQSVEAGQEIMSLASDTLQAELSSARAVVAAKLANLNSVQQGSTSEQTAVKTTALINAENNLEAVTEQQDGLVRTAYQKLLSSDLAAYNTNENSILTAPIVGGYYTGDSEGLYRLLVNLNVNSSSNYDVRYLGIEEGIQDLAVTAQPLGTKGLYVTFPEGVNYRDTTWEIPIPNTQGSGYTANLIAYQQSLEARSLAIATATASVNSAQADLVVTQAGSTSQQIAIAQSELTQARAQVSLIEARIEDRIVRAPFAGVVANLEAEVGELISPNSTVATVLAPNNYQVVVNVPEVDIPNIQIGNQVAVQLDAYPGEEFTATVIGIDPSESVVDGVTIYEATLIFIDTDPRLRPGLTADTAVEVASVLQAVSISSRLINYDEETNQAYVWVPANSSGRESARRKEIDPGLLGSSGYTAIIAGLQVGDIVLEKITE